MSQILAQMRRNTAKARAMVDIAGRQGPSRNAASWRLSRRPLTVWPFHGRVRTVSLACAQSCPIAQTPTFLLRSAAICRPTRRTFIAKPSTTLSRPMPETNGRRRSLTVRPWAAVKRSYVRLGDHWGIHAPRRARLASSRTLRLILTRKKL
jgi:hypothetical protein